MTAALDSTPSAVLDRASLVLDAFDGHAHLTLAEIVRRTGLPRSSAHRILERLVALRWLRRTGRDYALGIRLVELGSLAIHQDSLHTVATPYLHELSRMTGFVAHLAILDDADVVYLEKIGDRLSQAVPSRVGGRQPAHCTAIGKALLAHSDSHVTDTRTPLRRKTTRSIGTATALSSELAKVRGSGVAFEREESLPRFGCVAAPIGDPGSVIAAVSICGPVDKMSFDHRMAAPVRMAALGIWRELSGGSAVTPTLQQRARPRRSGR
ncbi:IclR family transcriptional regulator [Gordonia sp. TBRC 11910]|uniref:IclR family transcriptional regulator n=1 Tax=Gordonia asplenii TaxID=2725283 RepID=A0A848KZ17_9ACTN|nr:IclR family transcriptional regulator [Gordonia asplenii]NMO01653.1 IclR family transcriptional regulator [Gordonia asplenii]